jgi:hypothetical protein
LLPIAAFGCGDDPVAPRPTVLLVTNGDFETGDLSGWTDSIVSSTAAGVYVGNDTLGPASGAVIPLPPEGNNAALFDQNGATTHILYQDIMVPAEYNAAFQAMIYLNNTHTDYVIAATEGLSVIGIEANQQFRIDVMDPAAPVDDVGAGVLQNLYQTMPGDSLTRSFQVTADLSAYAGQTVRLRFAAAVKQFFFQIGIDAVQVTGT